jgi:hypothetical protein
MQGLSDSTSSESLVSVSHRATFVEPTSLSISGPGMRSTNELRKHPAYAELQLAVSPAQFGSIKRMGALAFKDPILITRQGVIIHGYARSPIT